MKEVYCPCVLEEGIEIKYNPSILNRISHIGKKYYSGHTRWLLTDKKGRSISCDCCGNIANGVITGKVWRFIYTIPLCKKHIGELLID
jgi:hypothetical protein